MDTLSATRRMSWSAKQYAAFEDERTRPVRDLLAALPAIDARSSIDLGCGPGNSTELLAARFPDSAVSGIDNSPDMLAAARARLPAVSFALEDIEHWAYVGGLDAAVGGLDAAARFDVVLANAVLQWLPDHARLFPALLGRLATGGGLAVQMPDNLAEPAHRLMREVAADGPWAGKLAEAAAARFPVGDAAWYHELLRGLGCTVDIWRTTYHHVLAGGAGAIVEWFKGSALRPFIAALDADERGDFLARYQCALTGAYAVQPDGSVLLPFPRLFMVALK